MDVGQPILTSLIHFSDYSTSPISSKTVTQRKGTVPIILGIKFRPQKIRH